MNVIIDYFKKGEKYPTFVCATASDLVERGGCLGRIISYSEEDGTTKQVFRMGGYIDASNIDARIGMLRCELEFLEQHRVCLVGVEGE